jgi:predicted GIY-YIG superfamily endonuclease
VTGLYLLHFDPPYRHAGHYLGFAVDVDRRVAEHRAANGKASPLVKAAIAAGSVVTLARIWPGGDRKLERRLKNQHGSGRFCPICLAGEGVTS